MLKVESLNISQLGVPILKNVSFEIEPCGILAVLGRNGVGKSTLIRSLMGLHSEVEGSIEMAIPLS